MALPAHPGPCHVWGVDRPVYWGCEPALASCSKTGALGRRLQQALIDTPMAAGSVPLGAFPGASSLGAFQLPAGTHQKRLLPQGN